MSVLYFNGPVQNGAFTLAERPGKAAGIRAAAALNALLGVRPVPHLWNTVTLSGDLRHRAAGEPLGRREREEQAIAAKYARGEEPRAGVLTDTAPAVAALALELVGRLVEDGTLSVTPEHVRLCSGCGHMTGVVAGQACRACGGDQSRAARRRLLVFDRPAGQRVLEREDFLAAGARTPSHLLNIAQNTPPRLVLSRTRDHGVSLAPLGLDGLVLDPRAGLHIAVLAAAAACGAEQSAMTITANAAANVAAYGRPFRRQGGARLRYALHGRIPYDTARLGRLYEVHRVEPDVQELFTTWFLPLASLRERAGIDEARLPGLLKFCRRAHLARPATPAGDVLAELRRQVEAGDMRWVMDARTLAHAIAAREDTQGSALEPEKGAN
ncbi:hypothetical protein [Streptomyces sp. AC1-42T]|uniref:hypothetical protein n=1 Tax=Streptomyces sp. AC1-42T TaxID=2218665 RepID=UPI000DADC3D4|nr:hypothetical protein [Streptomyces sp. AC1-42T]PZT71486.1 hypothetical protein DNK55_32765 [Streptomyces sp. AC1-42T]